MRIVVYTKEGCPFCSLLKLELTKQGIAYESVDLSDDSIRKDFYARAGVGTVPQVYKTDETHSFDNLTGERLGGWSDLKDNWELLQDQ